MMGRCSVTTCERPTKHRGLCGAHYQRLIKHGDVQADVPLRIKGDDLARFMAKVDPNGPIAKNRPDLGRCWIWQGYRDSWGYGFFAYGIKLNRRDTTAHRWAYEHFVGPVPDALVLDHFACDNGRLGCVNPYHLVATSVRANTLRSNAPAGVNARKTHCVHGHEFTEENIYRAPSRPNRRVCRACMLSRSRGAT